ncbi:PCI domain-containing protein [Irpex rosettiformis]|uniref:PCI domain-containing protein n=1 Tax=Irpex rosettiformis TaxID=378272 RepID=A0ACB8U4I0_9APHY|nr:PCI domain-containing protein [Irpex rosettiformis]
MCLNRKCSTRSLCRFCTTIPSQKPKMPDIDAVSIFAEGTFEEQIRELVNYLAQGRSDEEKATFIQPFENDLTISEGQPPLEEDEERRRAVLEKVVAEVKGLGQGSEREIEGFFNLLFAHFLTLFPLDSTSTREHLNSILQAISSSEPSPVKYRLLTNLFNALPRTSNLRLPVNQALIQLASAQDELDQLQFSLPEVTKWLSEWEISDEEKSLYLKSLVDTYATSEPEVSYQYQLSYVRSLPAASSQSDALDLVASALRLPSVFDFDALFRLDAVIAAKDSELYSLLQIFLNDGLTEYKTWEGSHAGVFDQYNLDQAQLERKIRLLSLTTLAHQNIGGDLLYSAIAEVLQVDPNEVERWVIDVLRTGLIIGKLSQTNKTFHVIRASARAFEKAQWEALEKRLVAWKTGLSSVREVVAATKKKNTPPPAAAAAVPVPAADPAVVTQGAEAVAAA